MQLMVEMLQAAMKKAIEHGLLPRRQPDDLYSQNLAAMQDILSATLQAADSEPKVPLSKVTPLAKRPVRSGYIVFRSGNRANYVPGIISRQQ